MKTGVIKPIPGNENETHLMRKWDMKLLKGVMKKSDISVSDCALSVDNYVDNFFTNYVSICAISVDIYVNNCVNNC